MNNSDKFRFVDATAKQSNMYDTQLPSQPKMESLRLQYQQIQKEKSLDEGSLIGSYEFLTLKDARASKNYYIQS